MTDSVQKYSAEWWCTQLSKADKGLDNDWRLSADKVVDRYLDDRRDDLSAAVERKYNIFWANVQILKSALYATPPKPEVRRAHHDAKDDVARTAAMMLERILTFGLQQDDSADHEALEQAVDDRLVPGLGQVWLRYDVDTETYPIAAIIDPMSGQVLEPETEGERIVREDVVFDYVHWKDFSWSPARTWREVWWVARRVWMTEARFERRFGKEKLELVKQEAGDQRKNGYQAGFEDGRVEVFEVWCKTTKKAYFLHTSTKLSLDEEDDPLGLDSFFPCPPPLLATHTTRSLVPRPDYVLCQDQYAELDVLNARISTLTSALRVVGMYDSGNGELQSVLTGSETRMVPVERWAAFAEKGGMKGAVDWFPVDVIAQVLDRLVAQRQLVIQQIYELTSISDIMRGHSESRETAKAQTLKAQYSSVRLQLSQQSVSRFVRSALRLKVEIVSRLFQPETIIKMSQIENTESRTFAQEAVQLIKDYNAQRFRIFVSEETLSLADYNAEREMRIGFLTAIGQFLSQSGQLVQTMPAALPYVVRMITWVAASFRGADDIETVLDEAASLPPPEAPEEKEKPDYSVDLAKVGAEKDVALKKLDIASNEKIEGAKLAQKQKEFEANMNFDQNFQQMSMRLDQDKQEQRQVQQQQQKFLEAMLQGMQGLMEMLGKTTQLQIEASQRQAEASQQTTVALGQMVQALTRKKRRVPVRDDAGDILYTEDHDIDDVQETMQ